MWIAGAVVLAFIVNNTIIVNAKVISGSMEATIMTGDRVLGNRLSYLFSDPQRLDVIVHLWPDDPEEKPFVKRIIGMPGETVLIVGGLVYINESLIPLDEAYLPETMVGSYGPFVVPDGAFFVLGDNRNNSKDSRDWQNSFVPRDYILGRVIFRIFPSVGVIN